MTARIPPADFPNLNLVVGAGVEVRRRATAGWCRIVWCVAPVSSIVAPRAAAATQTQPALHIVKKLLATALEALLNGLVEIGREPAVLILVKQPFAMSS
jgi:hypothetical protein